MRRLEAEEKLRVNEVRDSELVELLDGQTVALALKKGREVAANRRVRAHDGNVPSNRAAPARPRRPVLLAVGQAARRGFSFR